MAIPKRLRAPRRVRSTDARARGAAGRRAGVRYGGARLRARAPAEANIDPLRPRSRSAKRSPLPEFIPPQLAISVDQPPVGSGWAHEVKFDGYRLQLHHHDGRVTVMSRSGLDWTARFPEIAAAMEPFEDTIIDGEAVAVSHGNLPGFSALQVALRDGRTERIVFYAFDVLFVDGVDLRPRALVERKAELHRLLAAASGPISYVEHFTTPGDAVLRSACKMALEGGVSKLLDSPYRSVPSPPWQKTNSPGCREF